jgi:ABC-type Na+ efflux pump permease subunit
MGFGPEFFEYKEELDEFTDILNYSNKSGTASITAINEKTKKISFYEVDGDNVSITYETNTYQWDETAQMYVKAVWDEIEEEPVQPSPVDEPVVITKPEPLPVIITAADRTPIAVKKPQNKINIYLVVIIAGFVLVVVINIVRMTRKKRK